MEPRFRANDREGLTLRLAAVIAGLGYLLSPVSYAEFALFPKLVIPGNIERTVQNITTHGGDFVAIIFCNFVTLLEDVVIAWALYVLLIPVNRALSLLTAWFRIVYAAVALVALTNLVTVYRLLNTPEYLRLFGAAPLRAQVDLLLHSFRYDWAFALIIFAVHLILLGVLIYRSGYIPRVIGVLLVLDGVGWVVQGLQPYLYPNANIGLVFITALGELIFMLWLLIMGWRIKDPRRPIEAA
ncbi:MAG: DUF4386 domain-containing protein [Candidatus Eremiobacteraeota bacterium]|nr:DUF4386 domain-containing protein [Candidatus Eremiobacteraeota bacterium]